MSASSFIAQAYAILDYGKIEHEGNIYYSEEAVMNCLEFMKEHLGQIVEVDTEKILNNFADKLKESF